MRYAEIVREASAEDYLYQIYLVWVQLDHDVSVDPDAALIVAERIEKTLLSMRGIDDDQEDQIATATASFQEIITRAHAIIGRRDGPI